jgi:hypothetical protein
MEHAIYERLLGLSPGMEESLCNGSEQDIFHIAELVSICYVDRLSTLLMEFLDPKGLCWC